MRAPTPNQKLLSKVKLFCMRVEDGLHGCGLYHSYGVNLQDNKREKRWKVIPISEGTMQNKKAKPPICTVDNLEAMGAHWSCISLQCMLLVFLPVQSTLQIDLHFDFHNKHIYLRYGIASCNLLAGVLHSTWEGSEEQVRNYPRLLHNHYASQSGS